MTHLLLIPVGRKGDLDPEEWAAEMVEKAREAVVSDGDEVEPVFLFLAADPRAPEWIVQGALDLAEVLEHAGKEIDAQKEAIVNGGRELTKVMAAFAVMLVHEVRYPAGAPVLVTIFETESVHRVQSWEIVEDGEARRVGSPVQDGTYAGSPISFLHAWSRKPN